MKFNMITQRSEIDYSIGCLSKLHLKETENRRKQVANLKKKKKRKSPPWEKET